LFLVFFFFFSSRRRHTRFKCDWSSDVCSSDLVDPEFGRTTDPVRMYMREMGSVELLTREGEIEIAKRIEDGLKHMIQAISACPTTIAEISDLARKIDRD